MRIQLSKLECPHCGQAGVSMAQRTLRCPLLPTQCAKCGGKATLSYWSLICFVPTVLAFAIHRFMLHQSTPDQMWALGGLGIGLGMVITLMWPLKKYGPDVPAAESTPVVTDRVP